MSTAIVVSTGLNMVQYLSSLQDVDNYAGQFNKVGRVKSDGTGIEWVDVENQVFGRNAIHFVNGATYNTYVDNGKTKYPFLRINGKNYLPTVRDGVAFTITSETITDNGDGTIIVVTSGGNKTFSSFDAEATTTYDTNQNKNSITELENSVLYDSEYKTRIASELGYIFVGDRIDGVSGFVPPNSRTDKKVWWEESIGRLITPIDDLQHDTTQYQNELFWSTVSQSETIIVDNHTELQNVVLFDNTKIIERMGFYLPNDGGYAKFKVVGDGTPDGYNIIAVDGKYAVLLGDIVNGDVYGIVGDRTTDDTLAVQAAANRGYGICKIYNKFPAISSTITLTNSIDIIDGDFVNISTVEYIMFDINQNYTEYGQLSVDASFKPCTPFVISSDNSKIKSLIVKKLEAPAGSGFSTIGVYFTGKNNIVDDVKCYDSPHTNHSNASLPQAVSYGATSSGNRIGTTIIERSCSGINQDDNSLGNSCGYIYCKSCDDNGIYVGGKFSCDYFEYDGNEEAIVGSLNADITVGVAKIMGTGLGAINTSNAKSIKIGKLEVTRNANGDSPKQLVVTRNGQTNTGEIVIDNIIGDGTLVKLFAIDKGVVEKLVIGNVNYTVLYDNTVMLDSAPDQCLIADLQGCNEIHFGNMNVGIVDINGVLSTARIFRMQFPVPAAPLTKHSRIGRIDVTGYQQDGFTEQPIILFRGENLKVEHMHVQHGTWQTNIGPYLRETTINGGQDGINTTPTGGYWYKGEDYALYDAVSPPFRIRCTVGGTTPAFVTY